MTSQRNPRSSLLAVALFVCGTPLAAQQGSTPPPPAPKPALDFSGVLFGNYQYNTGDANRNANAFTLDRVKMLSDHKDAAFGQAYGTLIKDMRILSRAIFVVGPDDKLKYVEYVPEVSQHPNYEAALAAARS